MYIFQPDNAPAYRACDMVEYSSYCAKRHRHLFRLTFGYS